MQKIQEPAEFSHEWFETSSAAWKTNKIRGPNCTYKYRCQKTVGGGHRCSRAVYKTQEYCWNHRSEFLNVSVEEK